jgi:hypothetical protein
VLNVDAGQFTGKLLVTLGVVDGLSQLRSLGCGNSSADVAALAPNLVFINSGSATGDAAVRGGVFASFLGESARLHGVDGGNLFEQGFATGLMGCV